MSESRKVIGRPPDPSTPQLDAPRAFVGALTRGGIAEFFDGPLTATWLAFRLYGAGPAILVRAPDGRHLGTFADPVAAAEHGFHRLDREATEQKRPSPHQPRQRPQHQGKTSSMTMQKETNPKAAKATPPALEPSDEQRIGLEAAGGSDDHVVNLEAVKRALATAWPLDGAREDREAMIQLGRVTRATMAAFEPTDAVQGLLVAQAVALHHGAMESMRRAVLPEQTIDGASRSWKDAASLSRAMIETISALDRWRRRGEPLAPFEF